jgi:hypothetical protein
MNTEIVMYGGPLLLACLLSIFSSYIVMKKERSQTTFWFSLMMITILVWSFFYALEIIIFDKGLTLLFGKIKYIGIVFLPVTWCFFSLSYSRKDFFISKGKILGISFIPLLNLILIFSNSLHHLFWISTSFTGNNSLLILSSERYIFFWFHTFYSYTLVLIGTTLILWMLFRTKDLFTKQNLALLMGVLSPFIGNIFIVFDFISLPYGYDITPVLFVISGLLFSFSLVYYNFLELIPAARDEIFQHFTQAIFVLNKKFKIVDKNTAADNLFNEGYLSLPFATDNLIGCSIDSMFNDIFNKGVLKEIGINSKTISLEGNDGKKWLDVSLKPLFDKRNRLEGHLFTLDDVTVQKNAEMDLHNKLEELQQFKQVTTDRELKMIELKNQIEQLKKNRGGK